MADTVGVVFEQKYRPYNAGEAAGFAPGEARQLVSEGIARYRDPENAPTETGGYEGGDDAGAPSSTHELTVPQVREAVEVASLEELGALLDSELEHPDYEGGRSTALAAIREAIEARESS